LLHLSMNRSLIMSYVSILLSLRYGYNLFKLLEIFKQYMN
jgi:hypothetical protein